ncbi:uncharacterized protein LOC129963541 [Argiope bruennichi]|uniref:uncharacterized protein LOC129963541 n=1 Tax=Argiope bruennichi TaxID=94029 RepID=UPI0024946D66|nr:uncharacterized protein LOC129963541 [Argiope bruennichi]
MHVIVLFTLFGIIFASNDYPPETESEDLESALCENEDGEMSAVVVDCYDKIGIQKYSSVIKECYEGIDGEVNGRKITVWYCKNSNDKTTQADTCAARRIAEQEGNEEAFTDIMNGLTKCIGEYFSQ